MSQTSGYDYVLPKAQAGQLYDLRPYTISSFAAEVVVDPGQPVMRGADPETQVLLSDATAFLGIVVFTHYLEQELPAPTVGASFEIGDTVPVITNGAIWVVSSVDTVIAGETAYVTAAGEYTNIVGVNLEVGEFLTGGDTADLVVVRIP